jgi:hypothetical protein
MMYPRNSASPERIAIGPVVQISDGAVQTSGCTVRVLEAGGTEGDGGGTTAYSTDGVVLYTPTQAETDQNSFVLIAKKTGCIPASVTVVTSASATAGTVLLAPVTHTSAVVPTVTTLTNLPAITSNWLTAAGIAASALNGKGDWNIGKTGYALTATTGLGNQTANITGNLSGSVGSVTGAVGSVTGSVGSVTGAVGSVTGLTAANLDAAVSSRMASYTQPTGFLAATFPGTVASPTNITAATGITLAAATHTGAVIPTVSAVTGLTAADVGAIKTQTDKLTFTQTGHVDANVQRINDVAITGDGQSGTEFGV